MVKKEKKDYRPVITFLVGILIISLVAFNFDVFTGKSVKERQEILTKIYVSSSKEFYSEYNPTVNRGSLIYFTVEVGSFGAKNTLTLYDANHPKDRRIATFKLRDNCGGETCRPNKITSGKYRINSDWAEGIYCGKVTDLFSNKEVEACF